ncbi:hypothetical protein [Prochlorococcus sp. MIT 1303]|uniref:hypothetical protein n=1 Tax=Prochlorococcus sp. MIT 1303 TaxID=1723647 RepID=UPI0007B3A99C|nr:hypothetical protein [Prochlorococcus sp. MIT 1303]
MTIIEGKRKTSIYRLRIQIDLASGESGRKSAFFPKQNTDGTIKATKPEALNNTTSRRNEEINLADSMKHYYWLIRGNGSSRCDRKQIAFYKSQEAARRSAISK